MNQSEYEKLPGINWSRLKLLDVSPYHFQNAPPRNETPLMRIGLAGHARLLEPGTYDRRFTLWPDARRGNAWKEFKAEAEAAGLTVLNQNEHDIAKACAESVMRNAYARDLIETGLSEAPQTWTDEETGVLCKGRMDHIQSRLVELKLTTVIDPRRFSSHAARLKYHCQCAFYQDGAEANRHFMIEPPAMIVVDMNPPHESLVYEVPEVTMDAGRLEYRRLLALYKQCTETNTWPGLGAERRELLLPAWAYNDISDGDLELTMGGVSIGAI